METVYNYAVLFCVLLAAHWTYDVVLNLVHRWLDRREHAKWERKIVAQERASRNN